MNIEIGQQVWIYAVFGVLLLLTGAYCILVSQNLIRILIGIELFTKAVTLMLVAAAYANGRNGLGQSLVITLIVVEVVVIAVAAGVIINSYQHTNGLDARNLRNLKG